MIGVPAETEVIKVKAEIRTAICRSLHEIRGAMLHESDDAWVCDEIAAIADRLWRLKRRTA